MTMPVGNYVSKLTTVSDIYLIFDCYYKRRIKAERVWPEQGTPQLEHQPPLPPQKATLTVRQTIKFS